MSIFQKHCPECAAPNAPGAISCKCGYCFDPEALASADPSAYADQQDHLYRDYLEARIAQAESELIVAREQANADPTNTYKASGSLLAAQTLSALRAEMKQLSLRISAALPARRPSVMARPVAKAPMVPAAVKITPVARPNAPLTAPTAKPFAVAAKPAAPIAVSSAAVARKPALKPHVPAARANSPAWRKAPKASVRQKTSNPLAAIVRKAKAVVAARPMTVSKKTTAPQPRKPIAPPRTPAASNTSARPVETARPPINGENRAATPSVTSRPDESFRRMQAQKADAIAPPKPAPTARPPLPPPNKPAPQRAPVDIPPVALLKKQATTHECPNCTAAVAAEQTRCTCGYVLSSPGEEVPAVALDATALAILTEGISFQYPNRRR